MTDTSPIGGAYDGTRGTAEGPGRTAAHEAHEMKQEFGTQARRLMDRAGSEAKEQAAEQQGRAANGLRAVGSQLRRMADNADDQGMAVDLVSQAASRANSAASWLDQRDPGDVLEEVKSFARRRPGVFIAVALGAGVVAGRLTRALVSGEQR